MPLIKPEIQEVLRQSGLMAEKKQVAAGSLTEKLESAGLGLEETLEELATILKSSTNESLRVRIGETVLKAHGALKETAAAPPSFTIVIQGSEAPALAGVPSGINPILLPRQLHKILEEKQSDLLAN